MEDVGGGNSCWSGRCRGCEKRCPLQLTTREGRLASLEGNSCGRGMCFALLAQEAPERCGFQRMTTE